MILRFACCRIDICLLSFISLCFFNKYSCSVKAGVHPTEDISGNLHSYLGERFALCFGGALC